MIEVIFSYLAIPVFIILACREWLKSFRAGFSYWRSFLGLTSLLIVSANWLFILLSFITHAIDGCWPNLTGEAGRNYLPSVAAVLLAFGFRGKARLYGMAASVLLTFGHLPIDVR